MQKIRFLLIGIIMMFIGIPVCYASNIKFEEGYDEILIIKSSTNFHDTVRVERYSYNNHMLFSVEPFMYYPNNSSLNQYEQGNNSNIDELDKIYAYEAEKLVSLTHDYDWYKVAQFLIWENHTGRKERCYLDSHFDFASKDEVLENIALSDYQAPSFLQESFILKDKSLELEDYNNVLNYYDVIIKDGESITYKKEGNKLVLIPINVGTTTITLERKNKTKDYEMELLTNEEYTNFISAGNFNYNFTFTVTVTAGFVEVTNNSINDNNISYGLYDNKNNLVYTFDINKKGNYLSKPLPTGNYTMKQVNIDSGSIIDDTIYNVVTNKEQISKISINLDDKCIGNVLVNDNEILSISDNGIINDYSISENIDSSKVSIATPDTYKSSLLIYLIIFVYCVKKATIP